MADVVNPEVVAFVNQTLRPVAEALRNLDYGLQAAVIHWNAVRANCPNDTSPIQDGREGEGISRLVGSDAYNVMTIIGALETVFATGNYRIYVSKPCVRPLDL